MRLLLVTPIPPQAQPTNAVGLVTHSLLAGLRPRHDLTLVTVAGPDPAEFAALAELEAAGVTVHAIRRTEPVGRARWARRWKLARGILGGRLPFRTVWFYEPALQHVLNRLLAEQAFDIIQLEDNAAGVYRYATRRPIILTEHEVRRPRGIDWSSWTVAHWFQWLWDEVDWRRWPAYQRRVWRGCTRLQVFTPRDAASASALAPTLADRVRVNPFGIELPPPADRTQEVPGSLVFAGGFTHQPNVDAALWLGQTLMPALRRRCPGVRLTLVGSYPPPEVQALAAADIEVTGRVPAVEPYLERAAVVIAPLRIGGGMRMKVLQGLALGKAVVTTPLGAEGLTQLTAQPPLALAEGAEGLVLAAADLLANAPARHELGDRARAFAAEHFSAEAYARRTEAVYAEVLGH